MNGKLAAVAQLPRQSGVPLQTLRVAESHIRPIQSGKAGRPRRYRHSRPGQINLLSGRRARDTHVVSIILSPKSQRRRARQSGGYGIDLNHRPCAFNPGN